MDCFEIKMKMVHYILYYPYSLLYKILHNKTKYSQNSLNSELNLALHTFFFVYIHVVANFCKYDANVLLVIYALGNNIKDYESNEHRGSKINSLIVSLQKSSSVLNQNNKQAIYGESHSRLEDSQQGNMALKMIDEFHLILNRPVLSRPVAKTHRVHCLETHSHLIPVHKLRKYRPCLIIKYC